MKVVVENTEAQNKEEQNTNGFTNVGEIIDFTNDNLGDTMYIGERYEEGVVKPFIPEKKDIGRCYRTDFTLKIRKEAKDILKKKGLEVVLDKDADFFVYNERTNELVPFKKNDFMMFDHGDGYLTFDGTNYIYYDDNGYEVSRNTYAHDLEPNVDDIPEIKNRKALRVKPKPKKK